MTCTNPDKQPLFVRRNSWQHIEGGGKSQYSKVKGKAIPLQAWKGPEGSRRLRLPDFKTMNT